MGRAKLDVRGGGLVKADECRQGLGSKNPKILRMSYVYDPLLASPGSLGHIGLSFPLDAFDWFSSH